MQYYLIVAAGGALGAVLRYWAGLTVEKYHQGPFPLGTFLINVAGSLMIGIFIVILLEKVQLAPHLRPLVVIGFLGAFTTFSTFSLEVVTLMQQGNYVTACWYVLISVFTCVFATWMGMNLTRAIL